MLAKDVKSWLENLLLKADDKDEIEITVNGEEIMRIEYVKGIDSNGVSHEAININSEDSEGRCYEKARS